MVSKVRLKFPKFATNLAILLRSCQSNSELGNEVVNFMSNFIGKLRSLSFGVVGLIGNITTIEFKQSEKKFSINQG